MRRIRASDGRIVRVVNGDATSGHTGDAPRPAIKAQLQLPGGQAIAFSLGERSLLLIDQGNKRLKRVACPEGL